MNSGNEPVSTLQRSDERNLLSAWELLDSSYIRDACEPSVSKAACGLGKHVRLMISVDLRDFLHLGWGQQDFATWII